MKVLCVVGTRPEAIKMAPVILELKRREWVELQVACTAQHRHLVEPIFHFFGIRSDFDLDCMTAGQSLAELTARMVTALTETLERVRPSVVIAQGDTTTVMVAALASFYARIPFAHVEAGLRTGDLDHPFPEELNRLIVSRIAKWNFAPTPVGRSNLIRENVASDSIIVTGNTVIDALRWTAAQDLPDPLPIEPGQRLVLLTVHRRENFGAGLSQVFEAIRRLVEANPDLIVLYPVHPNPQVRGPAYRELADCNRIVLCEPLDYPRLIAAMRRAHIILTDSGGIQEEGAALGRPVLVLRKTTERPEAIEHGSARLIGVQMDDIVRETQRLLDDPAAYLAMARESKAYGDGNAARRIVDVLETYAMSATQAFLEEGREADTYLVEREAVLM